MASDQSHPLVAHEYPLTVNANLLRPKSFSDRYGLAAAAIYLALAIILFGRDLIGGLTAVHFGHGPDPSQMIWLLAWWPHALANHQNPFISPNVWAPAGLNLTWAVGMPLASVVIAPLMAWLGPVAAYNLLCLFCPVLAGWSAFVLARHLAPRWHAALFAGYIFGFSPYMLGALIGGHPYLLLTFPVPLFVLAGLKAYEGAISPRAFAVIATLLIVAEFLFSTEVAATMEAFAALTLILAWYLAEPPQQSRIEVLIVPLLLANLGAALILSPYLYYMIAYGVPHTAINSPTAYSIDLLNFILPTPTAQIGVITPLKSIAARFPGNTAEASGYVALPLLLMVALYARAHWHEFAGRLLLLMLALIAVAEIGPRLHIAGITAFGMPWKLATHIPLLQNALPARFSMYASLAIALIATLWLALDSPPAWLQSALIALTLALSLPNLAAGAFTAHTDTPGFFANGTYRAHLAPDETVLVLPFGVTGSSMQWLAQSGMYFRMAGGSSAIMPRDFEAWPIVNAFLTKTRIPDAADQLKAFAASHDVTAIIVEASHNDLWAPVLTSLDAAPRNSGGVLLYHVPDLSAYRSIPAAAMERRADQARFGELLSAARRYLAQGLNPADLSPLAAEKRGQLPPHSVNDPGIRTKNGLFLGPLGDGMIGVGMVGSYEALCPLIARYRPLAAKIFFPYPKELSGEPHGNTFMRLLVIGFTPKVLAQLAPAP
jgi:hypothetical protein